MTKQKSVLPFIGVPAPKHATEACLKTENQDPVYSTLWTSIRRTIATFFAERAKRLHASPDDGSKTPLTVTEQLNLFEQLQRIGPGTGNLRYGSYPQEPVRFRPNVDHLVRRPKEDVNDAEFPEVDGASDQSDDQPI
jgi:hypothetical protein